MTRVLIIGVLLIAISNPLPAQMKTLGGYLSYSHQYHENLTRDDLSTSRASVPALSLQGSGFILHPALAEFEFQTYLTESFRTSNGAGLSTDFESMNWTIYNLNLSLFQFTPVWLLLRSRDAVIRSKSSYGTESGGVGRTRSQEQSATLSLRKIPYLPEMVFDYSRAHSLATEGMPAEARTETFTFSTGASNGTTSLNASGTTTKTEDVLSDTRSQLSTLRAEATKSFTELHIINVQSEYSTYDNLGLFSTNLSYNGTLDSSLTAAALAGFSHVATPMTSTSVFTGSTNVGILQDEHWRYNLNLGTTYNSQISNLSTGLLETSLHSWRGGASVSHQRELGAGTISNSLSLSGIWETNHTSSTSFGVGLSNGYSRAFGGTTVHLGQSSAMTTISRRNERQFRVAHRLNLSMENRLAYQISNQTDLSVHDNRITGTSYERETSSRVSSLNELLRGSFYYLIPFSVSAGGSVSWYAGEVNGRAYGWSLRFFSGRFFLQNLTAGYDYRRTYDVSLKIESVEQEARIAYAWRGLNFGLVLHEQKLLTRLRDITFTVSRPF